MATSVLAAELHSCALEIRVISTRDLTKHLMLSHTSQVREMTCILQAQGDTRVFEPLTLRHLIVAVV